MNNEATVVLMKLNDRELAEVLEYVLERRAIGFEETFSTLAPYETLLLRLRKETAAWKLAMAGGSR